MAAGEKDDKKQIGLTQEANEAIAKIASDYFGGNQQDAYRFAISYAMGAGLDLADAPTGGYVTKYHAEAVESGTALRDLLQILEIGDSARPFATIERLAELGVRELARRLDANETISDILQDIDYPSGRTDHAWPSASVGYVEDQQPAFRHDAQPQPGQ